jgi:hypothetical protein
MMQISGCVKCLAVQWVTQAKACVRYIRTEKGRGSVWFVGPIANVTPKQFLHSSSPSTSYVATFLPHLSSQDSMTARIADRGLRRDNWPIEYLCSLGALYQNANRKQHNSTVHHTSNNSEFSEDRASDDGRTISMQVAISYHCLIRRRKTPANNTLFKYK